MAKAQKVKPDQVAAEFIKTPAGSILIAVGVGIVAFPYAVNYVVKKTAEEGGEALVYSLGVIWQGIKGEAGKAKEMMDLRKKALEDALKGLAAAKWHLVNPDVDLHVADPEATPGKSDAESWIEDMRLPDSSLLLKKPADQESLNVFKNSGDWNYYGVYTLNNNDYWLIIPKGIEIYKPPIEYKNFTTARRLDFCATKRQEGTWEDFPDCYDLKEYQELLWPTRWPV